MHKLKAYTIYQTDLVDDASGFTTLGDVLSDNHAFEKLVDAVKADSCAPNNSVAISIFMRKYGFFLASLLSLATHKTRWSGSLHDIHIKEKDGDFRFQIEKRYLRKRMSEDLSALIKEYGHDVVECFSQKGRVSSFILWENIWGYVLWIYGQLDTDHARKDLQSLIENDVWQPFKKRSPFKRFLNGRSLDESSAEFKRVTCCLLKELPANQKCSYCPFKNLD
ncbi:IucA/IucC family C-terminal-domain containing protein [Alteribacter aurantiacus]|uniref:IucA/IucC family C-terminal-domain containing protein n=1 Tax=Alteribacter aurantiacus TaxID=254410 RepID=UPI00041B7003|nr:IucA/IucC family C-terminal-domain containing protein [Alteribacter aurantiacus]